MTGDLGYIGTHLVTALKAGGLDVIGFDLKRGQDLRKKEDIIEVFYRQRIQLVIHLAALIDVGQSEWDRLKYYQTNTVGTINLVEAMEMHGCESIIFASTAAVYQTKSDPLIETDSTAPASIYGHTKLMAEEIIKRTCPKYTIFRFFNVAGTNSRVAAPDRHSHLVPAIIKQYKDKKPLYIFGNDYNTIDGTCVRDYVHVDDIVSAIVKAGNNQGLNVVINLGTSSGLSVQEVIDAFGIIIDDKLEIKTVNRRIGDTDRLVAEAGRAYRLLNWECQKDIGDMIRSTLEYW